MERLILAPEIVLNSGHKMPLLGLGTGTASRPPLDELTSILVDAIDAGIRHFDTAAMYGTEEAVGRAVRAAVEKGLISSREEVFITSKLSPNKNHRDGVLPALRETLSKLGMEYVDLYLVHWPLRISKTAVQGERKAEDMLYFEMEEVWEAMEECNKMGLAKSIGVSNFSSAKISRLLKSATIVPAVNQVEMNVGWQQKKLLKLCKEKGIQVCAFSPLGAKGTPWGSIAVMDSLILKEIAAAKNKTVAQVALRWIQQQGAIPIAKSFNKERIKQNLQIFDNWELDEEDMRKIETIPQARACTGEIFVSPDGQYKTLEELWDGEV